MKVMYYIKSPMGSVAVSRSISKAYKYVKSFCKIIKETEETYDMVDDPNFYTLAQFKEIIKNDRKVYYEQTNNNYWVIEELPLI